MKKRSRISYAVLLLLTILLGLSTRKFPQYFPVFVVANFGDALYTVAVYLTFALLLPKLRPFFLLILAVGFSFLVEFSQLIHVFPLNQLRAMKVGRLLLGSGFLWEDLIRYLAGGTIVFMIDWWSFHQISNSADQLERIDRQKNEST